MTKNIQIKAKGKTNSVGLLKEFSQKVRTSGVIPRLKSIRYEERKPSAFRRKAEALRKIEKTEKKDRAYKLGKKITK